MTEVHLDAFTYTGVYRKLSSQITIQIEILVTEMEDMLTPVFADIISNVDSEMYHRET